MSDTPVLKIDYNELPVTDMDAAKAFYANAFGWTFEDYGPGYAAFTNAGLDGGLRLGAVLTGDSAKKRGREATTRDTRWRGSAGAGRW